MARTATLIWPSPTRRFLSPFPEVAVPRPGPAHYDDPQARAVECGTPVQMVGGRRLGPDRHSRYLARRAAEHRVCPGYRRPPGAPVQAQSGCKTPCKRVRSNAGGRRTLTAFPRSPRIQAPALSRAITQS